MVKLDYKKLTIPEMMNYIKEFHNDSASKAAFAAVAIKEQKEKQLVEVLDENGAPVTYTDSKGRTVTKKKRVDKPNGKTIKVKETHLCIGNIAFFQLFRNLL